MSLDMVLGLVMSELDKKGILSSCYISEGYPLSDIEIPVSYGKYSNSIFIRKAPQFDDELEILLDCKERKIRNMMCWIGMDMGLRVSSYFMGRNIFGRSILYPFIRFRYKGDVSSCVKKIYEDTLKFIDLYKMVRGELQEEKKDRKWWKFLKLKGIPP